MLVATDCQVCQSEAAGGNFDAFEELRSTKTRIQINLDKLTNGDDSDALQSPARVP